MLFLFMIASLSTLLSVFDVWAGGSPVRVLFWYAVAGIAWYRYETKKSRVYSLVLFATNPGMWWTLILFWPFVSSVRAWESLQRRFDAERFTVLSGPSAQKSFGDWSAALAYARSEASRLHEKVSVFDNAKFRRIRYAKELSPAMYQVTPAGKCVRCFARWR